MLIAMPCGGAISAGSWGRLGRRSTQPLPSEKAQLLCEAQAVWLAVSRWKDAGVM